MCEQTEIDYLPGDIVWVKLGPAWWPGQVWDRSKLPDGILKSLKKPPIAVVKFFDEDQYEYVKNLELIYKYNCRRKNEFIKKGLDMHRAKNAFMDKFPGDVCQAETLTNGDPDIITNELFAPEQKTSYANLFGTPSPKKKTEGGRGRGRHSLGSTKSVTKSTPSTPRITHPRFVGRSDHKIHILEQSTPTAPRGHYSCHICDFVSSRLNVIVLHNRSHSNGTYVPPLTSKKTKRKVKKSKSFATTNSIDEDLALIRQGVTFSMDDSSDSDTEPGSNKKRKSGKGPGVVLKKQKVATNICSSLLADWGDCDSNSNEGPPQLDSSSQPESDEAALPETPIASKDVTSVQRQLLDDWNDKNSEPEQEDPLSTEKPKEKSSCFDFEEEEEGTVSKDDVIEKTPGRKIPRVIPQKRPSMETDEEFKSILEETSVPILPEIPSGKYQDDTEKTNGVLKKTTESNEIIAATVAVPVTATVAVPVTATSTVAVPVASTVAVPVASTVAVPAAAPEHKTDVPLLPKKRIRNFEEFETLLNEQNKNEEDPVKTNSVLEISKLKTQLMNKLCESDSVKSAKRSEREPKSKPKSDTQVPIKETVPEPDIKNSEDEAVDLEKKDEVMKTIEPEQEPEKEAEPMEINESEIKQIDVSIEPEPIESVMEPPKENSKHVKEMKKSEKKRVVKKSEKKIKKTLSDEFLNEPVPEKIEPELELEPESVQESELILTQEPIIPEQVQTEEKEEEEKKPEETIIETEIEKEEPSQVSEAQKMLVDISDICIDNADNLSGLSTLAAVSAELIDKPEPVPIPIPVTVQSVLTLPTEEVKTAPDEKPLTQTLSSFSMDFSDSNSGSNIIKTVTNESVEEKMEISLQKENELELESELKNELENKLSNVPEVVLPMEEEIIQTEPVNSAPEVSLESEIAKLTDTSIETENVVEEQQQNTSSTKLLEILADLKPKLEEQTVIAPQKSQIVITTGDPKKFDPKTSKFVIKSTTKMQPIKSSKPIILSEKIIKPVTATETVSVKKVTSKRTYQDVEDIDTFIIQKPSKKSTFNEDADIILSQKSEMSKLKTTGARGRGKPKIIEQTIIKAADVPVSETLDDSMFDINSMPIVLSDQILTPESIENMPVVMTELPTESPKRSGIGTGTGTVQQMKLVNKTTKPETISKPVSSPNVVKNYLQRGLSKNQKVYQTSSKLLKNNPAVITQAGKHGRFIILPSTTAGATSSTGSKYTVGKRFTAVKNVAATSVATSTGTTSSSKSMGESSGNKIMIVTNQHGIQSRVLLTPVQQKLLGCNLPTTSTTKKVVPKSVLTNKSTILSSGAKGQQIYTSGTTQTLVTSEGQVLTPITQQQLKSLKPDSPKSVGKKLPVSSRLVLADKPDLTKGKLSLSPKTKTILIKGSQGQTLKKIQAPIGESTTNILLTQSGSPKSQLVSISGAQLQSPGKQVLLTSKGQIIKPSSASKTPERTVVTTSTTTAAASKSRILSPKSAYKSIKQHMSMSVPALAPISSPATTVQSKPEIVTTSPTTATKIEPPKEIDEPKQPNQMIIQDALGNQTTVTEGQILAIPNAETADGQSQSYILVTVDETGNFIPLNSDALMSLDPNLALGGGDLNNITFQFDQPQTTAAAVTAPETKPAEITETETVPIVAPTGLESTPDSGQQLIITGDPESTQKFLASLSEGNTDLSSLLSGTDGNIIINTDGQQILLNTDTDNQILLSVNSDNLGLIQSNTENDPVYKNQDILAAALADTDVFQSESVDKITKSTASLSTVAQLSPNSAAIYPMGNVIETSLTSVGLGSPIMTPLEVPSVSQKKIVQDEASLLTQVPSSLELPITVTDPSIVQTVSQINNDLQSNLDLPLTSPSFVYSLPNLVDQDLEQTKPEPEPVTETTLTGSMSMPLLTEELDVSTESVPESEPDPDAVPVSDPEKSNELHIDTIEEEIGLNQSVLCSSLSEPPPGMLYKGEFASPKFLDDENKDMTDSPESVETVPVSEKDTTIDYNLQPEPESETEIRASPPLDLDENSSEIPIQPEIVTNLGTEDEKKQE